MQKRTLDLAGWGLFVLSALGFIVASIGTFWAMLGSLLFLVACLVFIYGLYFGKEDS